MNLIAMFGLLPYFKIVYKYKSYRAMSLIIIGMLNHYNNSKNKLLRNIDILTCMFIGFYNHYNYKSSHFINYFVVFVYNINYLLNKYKILRYVYVNIIHVVFIQWLVLYEINREYKLKIEN